MKNRTASRHVKHFWAFSVLALGFGLTHSLDVFAQDKTENCETILTANKAKQDRKLGIENYLKTHIEQMKANPVDFKVEKLTFTGVGNRDVYNPAPPFLTTYKGERISVLPARVEPRENHESEVWLFVETSPNTFSPLGDEFKFKMEDPFWSMIDGELVFGGVETYPDPVNKGQLAYRTVFYRDHGVGVIGLKRFTTGPDRMKDIRILQRGDDEILVVTRPQNESLKKGGRGRVGIIHINSLADLNADTILKAQIIHNQVADDEWLGVNQMHGLGGGNVLFVAHVARYDMNQKVDVNGKAVNPRDYYGAYFTLDDLKPKIYIERKDIDGFKGSAKRPDLLNVLFNGGWTLNNDGTVTAYFGMGDSETVKVTFKNPFI